MSVKPVVWTPPLCPECGKALKAVRQSEYSALNSDQFDAVRAGDWYCETCKGSRGHSGRRYYWDREVVAAKPVVVSPTAPELAEALQNLMCAYEAIVMDEMGNISEQGNPQFYAARKLLARITPK